MNAARGTLACGDRVLELGRRTFIMGIVNVTPDSFSDGGLLRDVDGAVGHALALLDAGADIIDVGGESTRPGAVAITAREEQRRVLPVLTALSARGVRNICIDTKNADTARAALDCGAAWINDVSALGDPAMASVAAHAQGLVLMHAGPMTDGAADDDVAYDDVVASVRTFLQERVTASALDKNRLVVDPGIGFGKSVRDNILLTRRLDALADVGAAVLYGPSRKRFLGALAGVAHASDRDAATHGAIAFAATCGADIVRVHDVKGACAVLRVVDALRYVR